MKSQSGKQQPLIQYGGEKLIISFNSTQITKKDMTGEMLIWECDQIQVSKEPTKKEIVEEIIKLQYQITDEIAHINNKNKGDEKGVSEYATYQAYRDMAKSIAVEVLAAIKPK